MTDRIDLTGLTVSAVIGVHPWERAVRQRLRVNITLHVPLGPAAGADDITRTVDYSAVARTARSLAAETPHRLIETLACRLAERIIEDYPVDSVVVEVQKPAAVEGADHVAARVERAAPERAP